MSPIVGGSSDSQATSSASVPDNIKVEASGYKTSQAAARAFKNKYYDKMMKRKAEPQSAIVYLGQKRGWGWLTPGWGGKQSTIVDTSALRSAYTSAGYTRAIWIHGHFNYSMPNFSATDFGLVWSRYAPGTKLHNGTIQGNPITYMFNTNNELRVLTDSYLHQKFDELDFQQKISGSGLNALQKAYPIDGLPGEKL